MTAPWPWCGRTTSASRSSCWWSPRSWSAWKTRAQPARRRGLATSPWSSASTSSPSPKSWPRRKRGEDGGAARSSPRAQAAAGVSRELPAPARPFSWQPGMLGCVLGREARSQQGATPALRGAVLACPWQGGRRCPSLLPPIHVWGADTQGSPHIGKEHVLPAGTAPSASSTARPPSS